jgi:phosphate transport system substrate-binding protein
MLPTNFTRSATASGKAATGPMTLAFVIAFGLIGCNSKSSTPLATEAGAQRGSEAKSASERSVSNMTGTIKINGSSTVLPISNAVAEEFAKSFPNITVSVDGAGTGTGFEEFQDKKTDISDASRPIKPGELEKCTANGVDFIEIPIAYDGLTIAIHPENDWAKKLTIDQLRTMFVGANAAKKWSDVDPAWPSETINIYAPGTGSGTYDYFREVVVGKSEESLRNDMTLNEDDNILVNGVAGNKYSIGFFGVAYYEESKDKLTAVEIVNPKDGIGYLPTSENIASGQYAPFSRPLFIYVSSASLPRAEVATFVAFYLDKVPELCQRVDYVRLPEKMMEQGISNLEEMVTGTHYVDADGNPRSGALEEIFTRENLTK